MPLFIFYFIFLVPPITALAQLRQTKTRIAHFTLSELRQSKFPRVILIPRWAIFFINFSQGFAVEKSQALLSAQLLGDRFWIKPEINGTIDLLFWRTRFKHGSKLRKYLNIQTFDEKKSK